MASLASPINSPNAGVQGSQTPRLHHLPEHTASSAVREVTDLAALGGIILDPWQQLVLEGALGERPDGKWSAFEVACEVPRQNGKGGLLEARELAGLFLFGERLIIHSAHEFATAEEALERMAVIIESCPDFERRVKSIKRSHGQEGIYLKGGQRLKYKTRTKGGGRGLTADLVVLDEAMHIPDAMLNALFPTLSTIPNPQLWYTGSAVDQETMPEGVVFARLRERALKGEDPSLAYFGWSPGFEHPSAVTAADAINPEVWAAANPALGIRITAEYIAAEQRSMSPRGFAVERLGVGDWPSVDTNPDRKITPEQWEAVMDPRSAPRDPVCLAFDTTPDRAYTSICAAGYRKDGLPHVEVVRLKAGTKWVADDLAGLAERHKPVAVLWAKGSPAAALAPDVEDALAELGVEVKGVGTEDHAKACGVLYDAVVDGRLRHLGTTELGVAIQGARTRAHGEAWLWSRTSSSVNIAPLVTATLALWGLATVKPVKARKLNLADMHITTT